MRFVAREELNTSSKSNSINEYDNAAKPNPID